MFTLCSITTLAPRHHISWSRTLRDKPYVFNLIDKYLWDMVTPFGS